MNRNAELMFTPIDQKPRWQGTIKAALAAIRATGQGLMYAVLLVLMLPIVFLLSLSVAATETEDMRELKR